MTLVTALVLRRMRVPLLVLIAAYAVSILGLALVPGVDDQGRPWRMGFFEAFYFVSKIKGLRISQNRKLATVHPQRKKSLRMQSISHVDAVPPTFFEGTVDDVSGLGESARKVQDVRERHTAPLGDIGPALFTRDESDLAAAGKAPQFRKRE